MMHIISVKLLIKIILTDPYRHIIDSDKYYCFMCYQKFRESKKRGGEKALLEKCKHFVYDTYFEVMEEF